MFSFSGIPLTPVTQILIDPIDIQTFQQNPFSLRF